ncbi:SDR family oxidoreductase [Falsiroseomonas sp.]|uniref:SDR family oxidoreductase n=1 Tax=Falsiroseomonas sp. TaxID=2870721 RepID=UPI0035680759
MSIPATIPRTALVTGGAKRLGRAMALALAGAGFDIALHHATSTAEAEEAAAAIRRLGRRAAPLRADLAREAEVAALLPAAQAALGPIGVLVNNASTFERDEWHDATRESWDLHMEPNLRAPFVLAQAMARALPNGAEGVVVNLLDQRVWSLTPHFVSYTVSKAGLWALTQSLALALAPRIRVNGIGPGPALPSPRQTPEQFERQYTSVPLRRGTSPEEVAAALLAILSLPSMTGQMIALDGGQHLQWAPVRDPMDAVE